jgi:hypothetical protein
LKDPILLSYTTEELLYEYYDRTERDMADSVRSEEEADRIDDGKVQETLDWAEQEEKRDLEALAKKQSADPTIVTEPEDPMSDPANKEWVDKQIAEAKELLGDSFGEDINESFDD